MVSGTDKKYSARKDTICQKEKSMRPVPALVYALMVLYVAFLPGPVPAHEGGYDSPPSYQKPTGVPTPDVAAAGEGAELKRRLAELAEELHANLVEDDDPVDGVLADGLLVCTFVDINKLSRTSALGRYVAVQLMNEFQRRFFPVIDMRKTLSVLVQEKRGEFGLSRDPEEISPSHEAAAVLTGTYLVGEQEIIINAEIIDNRRALLLSSGTVILPRNGLNNLLLRDTASARKGPEEVMYMKRLEL